MKRRHLQFNPEWEIDFFFINNGKFPQCLICSKELTNNEKFCIQRHYEKLHKKEYFLVVGDERKVLLQNLKSKPVSILTNTPSVDLSNDEKIFQRKKASYVIAYELAKKKRPFGDAEFVRSMCLKLINCFDENEQNISSQIREIALSTDTIRRRTTELNIFFVNKLKEFLASCSYFSICLDESTDISDTAQLLVCIRGITNDFSIKEEMLALTALHEHTRGIDIYEAVTKLIQEYDLKIEKISCICTDGAKAMLSKKEGFIGQLLKNGIDVNSYHCAIHQQNLACKTLQCKETMDSVVKIVNKIRGGHNALTHRKFKEYLKEFDSVKPDLTMHTEVRWLSKGKVLERFFTLRKEILEFLKLKNDKNSSEFITILENIDFQQELGFLTDITSHINKLNLCLQGANKNICEILYSVDMFKKNLLCFENELKQYNLTNFKHLQIILDETKQKINYEKFILNINLLKNEFESRFDDFKDIRKYIMLLRSPNTCTPTDFDTAVQNDLENFICDVEMQKIYYDIEFWKALPEKYTALKKKVLELYSMFGTSYMCERLFSQMKITKTKTRNRLQDQQLESLMRISNTTFDVDYAALINN